jgi:hypothetical protein
MNKEDLDKILALRQDLINHYRTLKDYKNNKNSLMKEIDHAERIHNVIVKLDDILKEHVKFS